jgi:hypothetical protein
MRVNTFFNFSYRPVFYKLKAASTKKNITVAPFKFIHYTPKKPIIRPREAKLCDNGNNSYKDVGKYLSYLVVVAKLAVKPELPRERN